MIKFFHELTKSEFKNLVKKKITYGELAKKYPQPTWCGYPDATQGMMGCWSLMDQKIKSIKDCAGCDLILTAAKKEKDLGVSKRGKERRGNVR